MKAEELRKGNIIADKESGRIGTVLTIGESKVSCKMEFSKLTQHEDEWEGIPLTEDWLLRMGFDNQQENNSYQLDTNFGVSFWGRNGVINTYCESNEFGKEMIYVHDVQNRFHSLSGGQELTIKE